MLLAVDIGNTHIDLGLFAAGYLQAQSTLPTHPDWDRARWAREMRRVLPLPPQGPAAVAIASVVQDKAALLAKACRTLGAGEIAQVDASWDLGLEIAYDHPQQVGIDRLLGAAAARTACPQGHHAIVADAGTAITVDAVRADGLFCAGAITPGLHLGLGALSGGTSLLPTVPLRADAPLLSRNTPAGLQSGALHGNAALLDGLFERLEARLGAPAWGLLGGGDGPVLWPHTRRFARLEPALVLRGLHQAYCRHRPS
ncbi:MAG: type III pantothenate kinase [Candidatus Latescibacteria bacterium]|nr:type III pantothenate kinase [Candidatus Latescibacterota bacterium]